MKLICTIMPRSLSVPLTLRRSLILASLREVLVLQVCYLYVTVYVPLDEAFKMQSKFFFFAMPPSLTVAINTSAASMIMRRSLSVSSTLCSSWHLHVKYSFFKCVICMPVLMFSMRPQKRSHS